MVEGGVCLAAIDLEQKGGLRYVDLHACMYVDVDFLLCFGFERESWITWNLVYSLG